jgi:hypothetical protein
MGVSELIKAYFVPMAYAGGIFCIFAIWVLWMVVKSLRNIDGSLAAIANALTSEVEVKPKAK